MKYFFLALTTLLISKGIHAHDKRNDLVTQIRLEGAKFNRVSCNKITNLEFRYAETNSVIIEAKQDVIDYVKTEITENTANIYCVGNISFKKLKVIIYVKSLSALSLNSCVNVSSKDELSASKFSLEIQSTTNVNWKLNAQDLNINIKASTNTNITGNVTNFNAFFSDGVDYNFSKLNVSYGIVEANRITGINLNVTKKLSIKARNTVGLRIKGNPEYQKKNFDMTVISI